MWNGYKNTSTRTHFYRKRNWNCRRLPARSPISHDALVLTLSTSHRYTKLEDSGTLAALFSSANFNSTRPLLDDDLQEATEALNISTADIEKQTDILTTQYEILSRQHKCNSNRVSKQNREVERVRRKHEAERQNTAATVICLRILMINATAKRCIDRRIGTWIRSRSQE
jgi:hypothetical protein